MVAIKSRNGSICAIILGRFPKKGGKRRAEHLSEGVSEATTGKDNVMGSIKNEILRCRRSPIQTGRKGGKKAGKNKVKKKKLLVDLASRKEGKKTKKAKICRETLRR